MLILGAQTSATVFHLSIKAVIYFGQGPNFPRKFTSAFLFDIIDFIANTPRYSHITPVMINLHWLPVKFRIIFKVNLLTFKALHGLAPAYLSDIVSFKGDKIIT